MYVCSLAVVAGRLLRVEGPEVPPVDGDGVAEAEEEEEGAGQGVTLEAAHDGATEEMLPRSFSRYQKVCCQADKCYICLYPENSVALLTPPVFTTASEIPERTGGAQNEHVDKGDKGCNRFRDKTRRSRTHTTLDQ